MRMRTGMRIQCLWAGQTLSCVCILIYTSAEKGSGNNKRKNRTNQDELVPSFVEPGKRCGCSCCCSRYYCLRPRAVVIAVFAIFMPGQSRSPHTTHTAHTRTPTQSHSHSHQSTQNIKDSVPCKSHTAFLYFPIIFMALHYLGICQGIMRLHGH